MPKEGRLAGNGDLAHRSIQGGKEHIFLQDFFVGDVCDLIIAVVRQHGVLNGGFACIGVSDQSHGWGLGSVAALALGHPLLFDRLEFFFTLSNAVADMSAIQFQFLLPGTLVGA